MWKGDACSPFEAQMANMAAETLESTRDGDATTTSDIDAAFWEALGGARPGHLSAVFGFLEPPPPSLP